MPYDALGNYYPGDEEPSLDEMLLRSSKEQPIAAKPATDIKKTLVDTLMRYHPMVMQKQLQDVPRAAYNMSVAPLASTWAGVLGNVQAEGAARMHEALGNVDAATRARQRIELEIGRAHV